MVCVGIENNQLTILTFECANMIVQISDVVPCLFFSADQALIGYCKIIAEINRNKHVMRYRNEPRLTEKGKHEFKVRMFASTIFV